MCGEHTVKLSLLSFRSLCVLDSDEFSLPTRLRSWEKIPPLPPLPFSPVPFSVPLLPLTPVNTEAPGVPLLLPPLAPIAGLALLLRRGLHSSPLSMLRGACCANGSCGAAAAVCMLLSVDAAAAGVATGDGTVPTAAALAAAAGPVGPAAVTVAGAEVVVRCGMRVAGAEDLRRLGWPSRDCGGDRLPCLPLSNDSVASELNVGAGMCASWRIIGSLYTQQQLMVRNMWYHSNPPHCDRAATAMHSRIRAT